MFKYYFYPPSYMNYVSMTLCFLYIVHNIIKYNLLILLCLLYYEVNMKIHSILSIIEKVLRAIIVEITICIPPENVQLNQALLRVSSLAIKSGYTYLYYKISNHVKL